MLKEVLLVGALVLTLPGCPNQAERGGGGGLALARPVTLTMVPHMVNGKGHVTFTAKGDQVEIRLHAEQLPPPGTYALALVGPGKWEGTHEQFHVLEDVPVQGNTVDHTIRLSREVLAQWQGIELIHLPSGTPLDPRQAHPALVASLPRAEAHEMGRIR